jgi:hypothetical protein
MGVVYGTAKSGMSVASMGVMRLKPPLSKAEEKIVEIFFEWSVKALDLCNAICDA